MRVLQYRNSNTNRFAQVQTGWQIGPQYGSVVWQNANQNGVYNNGWFVTAGSHYVTYGWGYVFRLQAYRSTSGNTSRTTTFQTSRTTTYNTSRSTTTTYNTSRSTTTTYQTSKSTTTTYNTSRSTTTTYSTSHTTTTTYQTSHSTTTTYQTSRTTTFQTSKSTTTTFQTTRQTATTRLQLLQLMLHQIQKHKKLSKKPPQKNHYQSLRSRAGF